MKRLPVLLALVGSFLMLGLPAHAAGDATYNGTMAWRNPVTPVEGANEWTFDGDGAGTLAPDSPSNHSYTGPLSLGVRGVSQNESTFGGDNEVQITKLSGASQGRTVELLSSSKISVARIPGSPIVVRVPVNIRYCNQFGCIVVQQCVKVTITYSVWPYPGASAQTSRC